MSTALGLEPADCGFDSRRGLHLSQKEQDGVERAVVVAHGKARRRRIANLFKKEQRRHAPPQPCNPPRSALTFWVNFKYALILLILIELIYSRSGQLLFLGLLTREGCWFPAWAHIPLPTIVRFDLPLPLHAAIAQSGERWLVRSPDCKPGLPRVRIPLSTPILAATVQKDHRGPASSVAGCGFDYRLWLQFDSSFCRGDGIGIHA